MTKTAKHCKTRGPTKTNQNQSLSEEWEWDNQFPNVSVFKPSAHLCTSGHPKRWQWANTRQALPQSLWELLHLNTQRTSIIFNYFLFTMICKYGMIIMPHHRKAAKTRDTSELFDLHCCVRTFLSLWQHHIMAWQASLGRLHSMTSSLQGYTITSTGLILHHQNLATWGQVWHLMLQHGIER